MLYVTELIPFILYDSFFSNDEVFSIYFRCPLGIFFVAVAPKLVPIFPFCISRRLFRASNGVPQHFDSFVVPFHFRHHNRRRNHVTQINASYFRFQKLPYPRSIWFIVGNEFCERFSFYGMKGKGS